ncbi:MAG: GGDEF domain-containing protein [Bdellovibrionota bacterium]
MKQWVQKLIEQLDYDWGGSGDKKKSKIKISEDRATLLYVIDTYSKHLIDVEGHPVRKVRETLDGFAKELVSNDKEDAEDVLFHFRQYFMSYKTAEYAFLRKTFEDFKGIVWDFVGQLSEDAATEKASDHELGASLRDLKDAVEADSIPLLREKSRQFIDLYVSQQARREERRTKRVRAVKKNLDVVKKQLVEADRSMRLDHLTGAFNRKSFDEQLKEQHNLFTLSETPCSMIMLDIDYFKRINDNYGHDTGDFILKECVKLVQDVFHRDGDFVARIGGEEFAIVLPNHTMDDTVKLADQLMARIRKDVFIEKNMELRFTVSMGLSQLLDGETTDQWLKRADEALYASKNGGRNRYTIAKPPSNLSQVA